MGSQTISVPSGECWEIALQVVNTNPDTAVQKGVVSAKVTDVTLGIVKGEISDSNSLIVCDGDFEVTWRDNNCRTVTVLTKPVLSLTGGSGGGDSPQSDGTSEWYVDAAGDPIYVIKIYDEDTGVTTFQDPSGNPLVPGTDFFPKHDAEMVELTQELCAVNDSPADLPNLGDPAGSLYSVGDKIRYTIISDPQIFPPVPLIEVVWNLTTSGYPDTAFYYMYGGNVLNGVKPPSTDFGACQENGCDPSTPQGVLVTWG